MRYRFTKLIIGISAVCCLTGCPEGFMSEGITDDVCLHNLSGTTWAAPCHDGQITLSFVSCDLWMAVYDSVQTHGFYTIDAQTIAGELLANETPDSTFCGVGNVKNFTGYIDDTQIVIDGCTFVKQ